MQKYKMKFHGSVKASDGRRIRFGKGDVLEFPKGTFNEHEAEDITEDFKVDEEPKKRGRKSTKVAGEEIETASKDIEAEKR